MKKIICNIENKTIGWWDFILGVLLIATLRNILEMILEKGTIYSNPAGPYLTFKEFFLHFNSFWFSTFMALSLLIYLFTRNNNSLSNCFNVGFFAMLLILTAPIFDALIGNQGMILYPVNPLSTIKDFPYFWNPFYKVHGITIGMRYEGTIAALLAGWYIHLKTHKIWKSVVGGICFFLIMLAIGLIVPTICQLYENGLHFSSDFKLQTSLLLHTGQILEIATQKMTVVYLLLIICFSVITFYIYNRRKWKAVVANFRFTRTLHYLIPK